MIGIDSTDRKGSPALPEGGQQSLTTPKLTEGS
jgi:hypothetical protein